MFMFVDQQKNWLMVDLYSLAALDSKARTIEEKVKSIRFSLAVRSNRDYVIGKHFRWLEPQKFAANFI